MAHEPADVLLGKIHQIVDLSRRNAKAVVVQEGNLRRGGDAERPAAAVGILEFDGRNIILAFKIPQVNLGGQLFRLVDQSLLDRYGLGAEVDAGQYRLDRLVSRLGKRAGAAEGGQHHCQGQQHRDPFLHGYYLLRSIHAM